MSHQMEDFNLDALIDSLEKSASEQDSEGVTALEDEPSSVTGELESLLKKEASHEEATGKTETTGEMSDMTKKAHEQGQALAKQIAGMLKQAADIAAKNDELVAEQDAETLPTPQGTVEQVLKGLVERAAATGGVDYDGLVDNATAGKDATNTAPAPASGGPGDPANDKAATPSSNEQIALADETEKAAAVQALVSEGVNFADAISLVKAAAEELARESAEGSNFELDKSAAVQKLVADGISFDEAVTLVKEASEAPKSEPVSDIEKSAAMSALIEGGFDLESASKAVEILSR